MKREIRKAVLSQQTIELIYMGGNGDITKRRVTPFTIKNDYFLAYCFLRKSPRTFKIDQVLACVPVMKRERAVI